MDLAEPSEECKEGGPNTNKEDDDQNEDLPVLELAVPQEGPVFSIRLERVD